MVELTDIVSDAIKYEYEIIEITLTRATGSTITYGNNAIYYMNVSTNGTIKTRNVTAKILNSSNATVGTATVTGSGTSYTISVNTSSLNIGTTYKIKVLEGAIITANGTKSETAISTQTFRVISSGSGGGNTIGGNTIGGNTIGGNTIGGNTIGGNTIGGNTIWGW